MKIDPFTISVLENFASINSTLLIKEGNVLETISESKMIKAKAEVDTTFPKKCAFYDLWKFISMYHHYDDPEITFEDKFLTIHSGTCSTRLLYAEESLVTKMPKKNVLWNNVEATTYLSSLVMKDINKARKVLHFDSVVIQGDGGHIYIKTIDSKKPSGDTHCINLGETDKTFEAVFKAENLILLPDDYEVELSSSFVSKFTSSRLTYYIALDAETSKF